MKDTSMIWCVEDDPDIREIEIYTLQSVGLEAKGFPDGAAMRAALETELPALIILDIMLPGEDGVVLLKRLRSDPATARIPVIMATAKGAEFDKIRTLDLGADDYLVKPFGMMEMASRVKAVLRRCAPELSTGSDQPPLAVGPILMNTAERTVTADGEPVRLTYKEFELLRLLLSRPGMVFSRDRIMKEIWGVDFVGETRTVDMHIRFLRQKLGRCGDLIETIRNVGYRMTNRRPDE